MKPSSSKLKFATSDLSAKDTHFLSDYMAVNFLETGDEKIISYTPPKR
jgi:hypothetical protein